MATAVTASVRMPARAATTSLRIFLLRERRELGYYRRLPLRPVGADGCATLHRLCTFHRPNFPCLNTAAMRTPADIDIVAPEFPPRMDWLGAAFLRMDKQLGRPVLLEFIDTARINSVRTLPYLKAWHERYADAGLRVIGVHAPGYSFGRDRDTVVSAVERLEIPFPVALDPDFLVWREYGNKGWPGRYVFDRRLRLRYIHYGEGDYLDCELVIQELLAETDDEFSPPPETIKPLRPEDEPGVLLEPQTADIALP